MYVLSLNMWFQKLMRQFFFAIDKIVYNFIPTIYDLLISIARTSPLSQGDILEMADRIYKLLAIFMVFKVTFSLIMYVVNPDDFSDKTKGISKLGTNIIISLALLILVPYIFNYAYQLQTIILEDNSLAKLVFGEKTENNFLNTAGEEMAFITISPFFTPNTSIEELYECTNLLEKSSDGNPIFNASCSGLNENYESNGDVTSLYKLVNNNFSETDLKNYVAGVNAGSLGLMFRQDLALATTEKNEDFIMDYKYIFSTVVGVVVILLLITFCLDVAVRSIKLAFLQLIAPIPIISYVDPKSGKDGLFKKWYQMCFKTFLSLFIRLLALYFAVYIISKIDSLVDIVNGSYQSSMLIKIFIIVGALMFAKQLPKILEGLGIKLDGGGFTLNPLKKIENEAIGGKQISKAAKVPLKYGTRAAKGLATAGAVGGAALLTGQGLRGMGKAFAGAMKGEKFGKNFSNSYKAAHDRKRQVAEMKANGVSPSQVRWENLKNTFRGLNPQDEYNDLNETIKAVQDDYKNYYNGVLGGDKVAKALEQRRISAENAGDATKARLLQDAIDERVKSVKASGGRISLSGNATNLDNFAKDIENGLKTYSDIGTTTGLGLSSDLDKGLNSIEKHMAQMINHADSKFDGKFDYNKGDLGSVIGDTVADLKLSNGKSKAVDRAVKNSDDARQVQEVYKYVKNTGKK